MEEETAQDAVESVAEQPQLEAVKIPCGSCRAELHFDVSPDTSSFRFQCNYCGAESTWTR